MGKRPQRPLFIVMQEPLTSIDLFCGCGGFTLGLKQAGWATLAAIDFAPDAIAAFRANFPDIPHVLERDITAFPPQALAALIGRDRVDLIVGGPPCQGFSNVRRRDGSNHGRRLVPDERRELYRHFLDYVALFRPSVFVMENVPGIRSADGGRYFAAVQSGARALGYRIHGQIVRAADYGAPQKRVRQLIIGTRAGLPCFRPALLRPRHVDHPVTLGEAIGDLPPLEAGQGTDPVVYDPRRRANHLARYGRRFLHGVLEVNRAQALTAHCARPHSERDLRDFDRLREGEDSKQAMVRGVVFEFPYDKTCFRDRYTRQSRDDLCSTIVAHLAKDGLMFIHPTQRRSLTPREAARVQTFPDWFAFPVSRTHQFRVIGNAVPPLVAKAVGAAVKRYLRLVAVADSTVRTRVRELFPHNKCEATGRVMGLLRHVEEGTIRKAPRPEFLKGWHAIFFLNPGLHPDGIADKGREFSAEVLSDVKTEPNHTHLYFPFRLSSGWPLSLEPILKEAWRRYRRGALTERDFYCFRACLAGMGIESE